MFAADQLLNPIRADQPSGADLGFSPDFDAIKHAREADDPTLDQGDWQTDLKEADWDFVIKKCTTLLEQKTKDLRLAMWLTEAAAKKHYLRGMGEGFKVLAGLFDQYWDKGLYPESDGDDHDQRAGNLGWILGRVPSLLREVPVTGGAGYSIIDIEVARKHPTGGADGNGPKLNDVENARRTNSVAFRTAFTTDAAYCLEALHELEKIADERLGNDSPGFSNAREAIEAMVDLMPVAEDKPAPVPTPGEFYYEPENDQGPPAAPVPGAMGAVRSREQAIAQLRAVADFFRRTEPHSPVSYFAEKAAKAGEQNLHDWLRSVIKDPGAMAHIEELLGVQPPDGNA